VFSSVLILVLWVGVEIALLPFGSIAQLRTQNPRQTALMVQRGEEAQVRGKTFVIRQQWVPFQRMGQQLPRAVLVAEDGAFYEHDGIDWYELKESFRKNMDRLEFARGGSTITQQLAKNLYLSTSKSPLRKIKEFLLAKRLESVLSKRRILELYLNVIEWGDGIFGAEAAAQRYFGKPTSELSRQEAARLAAVIPNPLRYNPMQDSRSVIFRTNLVLARMTARGW
jgi:monofunctional biosynthetic peptidoglycan transglycosylase